MKKARRENEALKFRTFNQSEMQRAKSGLFGWGGERMETVSGMDCKVSSSFQHSTVEICVC